MTYNETRLDRQLRIDGWDQDTLTEAKIGIIGDEGALDSLYLMSSAALGLNDIKVISPDLDDRLVETAEEVNPNLDLLHLEGYLTHPFMDNTLDDRDIIVDLSDYNLANKRALNKAQKEGKPVIRASSDDESAQIFTYQPGREWDVLWDVLADDPLPQEDASSDPVLDTALAGIAVEETKELLMKGEASDEVIEYDNDYDGDIGTVWPEPEDDVDLQNAITEGFEGIKERVPDTMLAEVDEDGDEFEQRDEELLVVGAGGIGNFVGPALAYAGFPNLTLMDPDEADPTNLNRQVFLYDSVGENKAETLSERVNDYFDADAVPVDDYFSDDLDVSDYDAIFDCTDNFETRIMLSEAAEEYDVPLISGGTNIDAGQVVTYHPDHDDETPAEFLGLYDIVEDREVSQLEEDDASCVYRPDPSVIMTNQIIGGFMVDAYRRMLDGDDPGNLFYDTDSSSKF
jgi:molybdopterin/thiamine biosynthesis adenylyltransferase